MSDQYWSKASLLVVTLWTLVTGLTVGGWALDLYRPPEDHLGWMLLLTAGVAACAATVAHVRLYVIRMCALIRVSTEICSETERVQPIR